jgi:hypothetical protein
VAWHFRGIIMKYSKLLIGLAVAALPVAGLTTEPASPLPANVDRDVYCQLIMTDVIDRIDRAPTEQKTRFAQMIDAIHHSEDFYTGSAAARLSDAQVTTASHAATRAMAAMTADQRSEQVQYCLDDAMQRSIHYAERLSAK